MAFCKVCGGEVFRRGNTVHTHCRRISVACAAIVNAMRALCGGNDWRDLPIEVAKR